MSRPRFVNCHEVEYFPRVSGDEPLTGGCILGGV